MVLIKWRTSALSIPTDCKGHRERQEITSCSIAVMFCIFQLISVHTHNFHLCSAQLDYRLMDWSKVWLESKTFSSSVSLNRKISLSPPLSPLHPRPQHEHHPPNPPRIGTIANGRWRWSMHCTTPTKPFYPIHMHYWPASFITYSTSPVLRMANPFLSFPSLPPSIHFISLAITHHHFTPPRFHCNIPLVLHFAAPLPFNWPWLHIQHGKSSGNHKPALNMEILSNIKYIYAIMCNYQWFISHQFLLSIYKNKTISSDSAALHCCFCSLFSFLVQNFNLLVDSCVFFWPQQVGVHVGLHQ